jgi:hypothetical protein
MKRYVPLFFAVLLSVTLFLLVCAIVWACLRVPYGLLFLQALAFGMVVRWSVRFGRALRDWLQPPVVSEGWLRAFCPHCQFEGFTFDDVTLGIGAGRPDSALLLACPSCARRGVIPARKCQ